MRPATRAAGSPTPGARPPAAPRGRSPGSRGRDVGNQPLALEQLVRLLEGQILRRDDRVGRKELIVVEPLAALAHLVGQSLQAAPERRLVLRGDRLRNLLVE